jgi:hypothetical protein
MKKLGSGIKKFLIICGCCVALGLVLTVVGVATGGMDNLDKVDARYSWLSLGTDHVEVEYNSDTISDIIEEEENIDNYIDDDIEDELEDCD